MRQADHTRLIHSWKVGMMHLWGDSELLTAAELVHDEESEHEARGILLSLEG